MQSVSVSVVVKDGMGLIGRKGFKESPKYHLGAHADFLHVETEWIE